MEPFLYSIISSRSSNTRLRYDAFRTNIASPITNYMHEQKLNDDKRNIFVLKPIYLNILFDDLEEIMANKKGSTQYVSEPLVRGDNIRLFD